MRTNYILQPVLDVEHYVNEPSAWPLVILAIVAALIGICAAVIHLLWKPKTGRIRNLCHETCETILSRRHLLLFRVVAAVFMWVCAMRWHGIGSFSHTEAVVFCLWFLFVAPTYVVAEVEYWSNAPNP